MGERDVCPLFSDPAEQVCLQRLKPGTALFTGPVPSAELLVLAGALLEDETCYECGSWLRLPHGHYPQIAAGSQGATLYLKTGHLPGVA